MNKRKRAYTDSQVLIQLQLGHSLAYHYATLALVQIVPPLQPPCRASRSGLCRGSPGADSESRDGQDRGAILLQAGRHCRSQHLEDDANSQAGLAGPRGVIYRTTDPTWRGW